MQPKVTIIIPFYNCPYVEQAVSSALSQSYDSIEVILVNDGSTIHTNLLKPYLGRITYIEKENGGTASALNTGIINANGEYIAWLSSDDFFNREKIAKQMVKLKQHGGRFCHTSYALINTKNEVTSSMNGMNFPKKIYLANTLIKGCVVNGSTVLIKKDVFSSIGLFDESLPYTHDYEMWLRMLPHYEYYYIHEDLTFYRIHDQMGSKKHLEEIDREIILVQNKYHNQIQSLIRYLESESLD
ncbi:glycosyltransferase family 2 protein [Paenibacillus sp. GCM10023252]|uniref:glycosyltransferase family 2 protein n=1 Tax=Paenibacillus sp. GCM10023252 TaxID=3252649 RepID=UPI0036109611